MTQHTVYYAAYALTVPNAPLYPQRDLLDSDKFYKRRKMNFTIVGEREFPNYNCAGII